jgi:predicted nucleic acid-binding protein
MWEADSDSVANQEAGQASEQGASAEPEAHTALLDSSALVKRHVDEAGTAWVEALCSQHPRLRVVISRVSLTEVVTALCRRSREGALTRSEREEAIARFAEFCEEQYGILELDEHVTRHSLALPRRYPLRAYDAIQLATALATNGFFVALGIPPLLFVSADERLCEFARAEGLDVENPNAHPSSEDQVMSDALPD